MCGSPFGAWLTFEEQTILFVDRYLQNVPITKIQGLLVVINNRISTFAYFTETIFFVEFAIFTSISITGTSVSTPTVVAKAAREVVPNMAIATATASSKKFDAPIIPAGAAIL